MKTKTEIKEWLLDNAVDEDGDLMINDLDFSDFNGDVYIDSMKVKGGLIQSGHEVKGVLSQGGHEVQGSLFQHGQRVKGDLHNGGNQYGGNLYESPSTKLLKKISIEELAKLGYELKGEN